MGTPTTGERVRLAELLAALSLGSDLGMGLPMEHVLRECLISMRLADRMGVDASDRSVVYHTALLAWVGCHIDAYEQAKWFGDDLGMKAAFRRVDFTGPARARFMLTNFGEHRPLVERMRLGAELLAAGRVSHHNAMERHCFAAAQVAGQLGLGERVQQSITQTFERWDGKGLPAGARGDEILITARIVNLAVVMEVCHRTGDVDAAISVARQRSGTQFDPAVVDAFCASAVEVFDELESGNHVECRDRPRARAGRVDVRRRVRRGSAGDG